MPNDKRAEETLNELGSILTAHSVGIYDTKETNERLIECIAAALKQQRNETRGKCAKEVISQCSVCDGKGFIVGQGTEYGHDCGGDEKLCQTRCPVQVPIQTQEQCEYCGIPASVIRSLMEE